MWKATYRYTHTQANYNSEGNNLRNYAVVGSSKFSWHPHVVYQGKHVSKWTLGLNQFSSYSRFEPRTYCAGCQTPLTTHLRFEQENKSSTWIGWITPITTIIHTTHSYTQYSCYNYTIWVIQLLNCTMHKYFCAVLTYVCHRLYRSICFFLSFYKNLKTIFHSFAHFLIRQY